MIVRDEAENLPPCLASVQNLVDEMIVVDTGSRDHTPDIAQQHGAKVLAFEWTNDFAAARNAGLAEAQSDWILVLDADEVLVPEAIPALHQVMQQDRVLAATLLRQEIGSAQAPYSLVSRLFRRHPAIAFARPYHETIDDSVLALMQQESHWQVVQIAPVALHHTGYEPSIIAQRQKADRARHILESYLAIQPDDPYTCSKLGALYADAGEVALSLDILQRGLQATAIEPMVAYELHYHLGSVYHQHGDLALADRHYQFAAEQAIPSILKLGTYNNWGNLRLDQDNPSAAIVLYQQMVETDPTFAVGYFNLGKALRAKGNLPEAIACYQKATELQPNYAEAHQNLGVAWLKAGQLDSSMDAFRRAIALYQRQGSPEAEHIYQTLKEMGFRI